MPCYVHKSVFCCIVSTNGLSFDFIFILKILSKYSGEGSGRQELDVQGLTGHYLL